MPKEIKLPSLASDMEDAVIARWLKSEGDFVAEGDVLLEIETDKATLEYEAESSGRLTKILIQGGQRAKVNEVVALLLDEDEKLVGRDNTKITAADPGVAPVHADPVRKFRVSPLARRIARTNDLDIKSLTGSGPHGRIVRADVERAIKEAEAAPSPVHVAAPVVGTKLPSPLIHFSALGEYETIPHTNIRRTIARRLQESKTTIPHFYLHADCDVGELLALRESLNVGRDRPERISVNDLVIKAVAQSLVQVPQANAIWTDDAVLRLKSVDIAVAVATETGLLTPVIRGADKKSVGTISSEMKGLASKAREGRLRPEEYQGGGFSLSNLGMYGVKSFSAIINPPQTCILAVGAIDKRPVGKNDEIVLAPILSVTLSVDHRTVDGAVGAEWLAAFKDRIESPMALLL